MPGRAATKARSAASSSSVYLRAARRERAKLASARFQTAQQGTQAHLMYCRFPVFCALAAPSERIRYTSRSSSAPLATLLSAHSAS